MKPLYLTQLTCTVFVLLAIASMASGCARKLDAGTVQRQQSSIESAAREGQLVARQVTKDATLGTTTRVRMEDLTITASGAGDSLSQATASPQLEHKAHKLATIAGDVTDTLNELYRHPADKSVAHSVDLKLGKLARQAHRA
ncbi:MAG: hypothetical protein H7123_08730 [Thermoleophilia bacterium]|nr:hypothetical protein [Thermoleophilia bacterium]